MTTSAALAFHQQVQALAPDATADTAGTGSYHFATLTDGDGLLLAHAAGPDPAGVLLAIRRQLPAPSVARLVAERTGSVAPMTASRAWAANEAGFAPPIG